jgi:hypothetical protein
MMNVYVLVDRSGSMADRWKETIAALNSYVAEIAVTQPEARVTVACFDSEYQLPPFDSVFHNVMYQPRMDFIEVRRSSTAAGFAPIHEHEVFPRGGTPLLDALGRITNTMLQDNADRAVLVVLTDGYENASVEWKKDKVAARIKDLQARNWQVVFLGADFDAFSEAGSVGVAMGQTMTMTKGHYDVGLNAVARSTVAYASAGAAMSFTDEDRAQAAGEEKTE